MSLSWVRLSKYCAESGETPDAVEKWNKAHPGYKAASARLWYKNNRDRANARRRMEQAQGKRRQIDLRKLLKAKYGITLEDFHKWAEEQGGLCAICRHPPNGRRLSVDHDHSTGRIRGLLCHNCNSMLGLARDRPAVLQAAIEYLKGGRNF